MQNTHIYSSLLYIIYSDGKEYSFEASYMAQWNIIIGSKEKRRAASKWGQQRQWPLRWKKTQQLQSPLEPQVPLQAPHLQPWLHLSCKPAAPPPPRSQTLPFYHLKMIWDCDKLLSEIRKCSVVIKKWKARKGFILRSGSVSCWHITITKSTLQI